MRTAFVVAALAASLIVAEQASAQSFQFGPMAGVSIANVSGDDSGDPDSRTGLFAGAQVVWQAPGSMFGLETGLVYVQKGFKGEEEEGEGEATFEMDYIDVPVLLRIAPPMGGSSFTPAFGLGATFGFQVGCSLSAEAEGVSADIDCEEAGVEIKEFDYGLTASAGVDIPLGGVVVAPFARYTHGLANLSEAEDSDINTSVIMVGAGVRFGGGR